jgi:hypothetical protein
MINKLNLDANKFIKEMEWFLEKNLIQVSIKLVIRYLKETKLNEENISRIIKVYLEQK